MSYTHVSIPAGVKSKTLQVVGSVTITEQALAGHAGRKAQGLKAWGWLARGLYRVTGGPGLIPVHNPVGSCSSEDAARLWFCFSAALAHHAKRDRNGSHPESCEAAIRILLETVCGCRTEKNAFNLKERKKSNFVEFFFGVLCSVKCGIAF